MARDGVLGKRIAGKGMQGAWFSTGGAYRRCPPNRIATNPVVARRARIIRLPAIRLPHLPTRGRQAGSSVQLSPVRNPQRSVRRDRIKESMDRSS
jgi:hypothetical protein